MGIEARFTLSEHKPPVISYVHTDGIYEAYGLGAPEIAKEHLIEVLETQNVQDYLWMITIMWGDIKTKDKMIDWFGYNDIGDTWNGNPAISSWVTRNGILQPRSAQEHQGITCGEGIMILGIEEEHRKESTSSLEEYVHSKPRNVPFNLRPNRHI